MESREGVCMCVVYVRPCGVGEIPYTISGSVLNSYGRCSIKDLF